MIWGCPHDLGNLPIYRTVILVGMGLDLREATGEIPSECLKTMHPKDP